MDWTSVGYQLGLLTIANRQSPMTRFVMHGSTARYVLVLDFLGHIFLPTLPHTHLRPRPDSHARSSPLHPRIHSLTFALSPFFNSSRVFLSADGQQFEWRRCTDDPCSYDASLFSPYPHPPFPFTHRKQLFTVQGNQRIATYRRCLQDTPIGPSYGFMSYLFDNEHLLLESLIALCLNKWLDLPRHTPQSS